MRLNPKDVVKVALTKVPGDVNATMGLVRKWNAMEDKHRDYAVQARDSARNALERYNRGLARGPYSRGEQLYLLKVSIN